MLIDVQNIRRSFARGDQSIEILKGVSVGIKEGEFVSVMGPSGSGKSTLLHIIGGLDRPDSGEVRIGGEDLQKMNDAQLSVFRRRRLGFIFQFFNLLPTLTALENAALPLLLDGHKLSDVSEKAEKLLARFGLVGRSDHRPHQLSGGEMQRVAIARALITDPILILADEPTGNLDSKTGLTVLELLKSLVDDHGQTLVMVTHDPKTAEFANRHLRFKDGNIESDHLAGS